MNASDLVNKKLKEMRERPVFTPELVNKHYDALRPVWEPIAKKAVDKAFKTIAKKYGITQWKPTVKMKGHGGSPAKSNLFQRALDEIELDIWELDVGWEGEEEAYEKMCKKMKMNPDPEEGVTETMLACADKWADAWNAYQRKYAKETYGIDINFGN